MADSASKRDPLVRESVFFPFQIAVVCWIDLLGYGAMIAEAEFNPLHPKASEAMQRLRRFHQIVASHSFRLFPTLVMNDGAAAYRDLSLRSNENTYDFLMRAWKLFSDIRTIESTQGLPGARVVLATGFRMRGRRAGMDASASHFSSIMRRYQKHKISADQAIREAARIRQPFDIIPQVAGEFRVFQGLCGRKQRKKGWIDERRREEQREEQRRMEEMRRAEHDRVEIP